MNEEPIAAFTAGAILVGVALTVVFCLLDPWHTGYCAAACGSAGVVEVSRKVCICGTVDAPVAVRILGGES